MIVHQFVPNLEPGAVGAHTLLARDQLRAAGHTSDIFTAEVHADAQHWGAWLVREYRGDADVLVYQMAIGSVVADALLGRREPLVVNHHNLTPLRYINGWQPVAAHGVAWGRGQLRELARQARLGVAVSAYNERDLIDSGFTRTMVVPYLLDLRALGAPAARPGARTARPRGSSSAGSRPTRPSTTSSRPSPRTVTSTTLTPTSCWSAAASPSRTA